MLIVTFRNKSSDHNLRTSNLNLSDLTKEWSNIDLRRKKNPLYDMKSHKNRKS